MPFLAYGWISQVVINNRGNKAFVLIQKQSHFFRLYFPKKIKTIVMQRNCLGGVWCVAVFNIYFKCQYSPVPIFPFSLSPFSLSPASLSLFTSSLSPFSLSPPFSLSTSPPLYLSRSLSLSLSLDIYSAIYSRALC